MARSSETPGGVESKVPGGTREAASGARVLAARFDDFEELAETVAGWDFDWRQLDRGRLDATLEQIGTPRSLLTRVAFSRRFHQLGGSPPGFVTVGYLGIGTGGINWCGELATEGELLAFRSGGEYESTSPPGFRGSTMSFSEELLELTAERLGVPVPDVLVKNESRVLGCEDGPVADLRLQVRSLFELMAADSGCASSAGIVQTVEEEIPALLVRALASGAPVARRMISPAVRSRAVRRALALIAEKPDQPLTVRDLCRTSAVTERTLEYGFRERFGVSPKQYLKAVRLAGARRSLRRAEVGTKIAEVANRWGFWHLGQFAADYRRHFGELPSQTLRAAA